jgi:hypothetical protein
MLILASEGIERMLAQFKNRLKNLKTGQNQESGIRNSSGMDEILHSIL